MNKFEIGRYDRNTHTRTFFSVDTYGLMLSGYGHGTGDCIGRSLRAYFTYKDRKLVDAVTGLWVVEDDKLRGKRHPKNDKAMSRDHYKNTAVMMKLDGRTSFLSAMKIFTPYVISKMARYRLSLRCWIHALNGSKIGLWGFYAIETLIVKLLYRPIGKFVLKRFSEEVDQEEWILVRLQDQSRFKRLLAKILLPQYAILQMGWQLYVLPDSWRKERLKRLYHPLIGKTNYATRLLFGMDVTVWEVLRYSESMMGGRWSGYLNELNDRNMRINPKQDDCNRLDVDFLKALYNERLEGNI